MVSLGALWFVSDVMKRLDKHAEVIFEAHIKPVLDITKDHGKEIGEMKRSLAEINKKLKGIESKKGVSPEEVALIAQNLQALATKLDELDRQIPSRYRIAPQKK